jgi:predicted peroxiredoxin
MANKLCVSITHAKDNTDKATVGFVVANAAVGSGKETLVFLSVEAVRLSQKGFADGIHEEGFAPLKELMDNFAKAGGTMYVCSPCFKKRQLDENNLVAGASVVGGAKLVEFLSDGSPCITY